MKNGEAGQSLLETGSLIFHINEAYEVGPHPQLSRPVSSL